MTVSLDELHPAAVNTLRRLGAGEDVEAGNYQSVASLSTPRDQLRRNGLVAEQSRGAKTFFVITAIGRTLLPAIARRDEEAVQRSEEIRVKADAARRIQRAAPLLLTALRGLLVACEDADTGSDDDTKFEAAMARQHQAMVVAKDAIKHATGATR